MMTAQLPTLLAVLGTVLMAIVIFAPAPMRPTVTASCAPPVDPLPQQFRSWEPIDFAVPMHEPDPVDRIPSWPALFDARASGCDAEARHALAAALGAVRTPWAAAILQRALDDEVDETVRGALDAALRLCRTSARRDPA
ncbi:MAG TPA: hypothetical protein VGD01_17580 [Candidatus Elarobacter sp.]|jgi:hypothetical protein